MTQPNLSLEEMEISDSAQKSTFEGSSLDIQYLEKVQPVDRQNSLNLEFRVQFNESGSFFIQIQYFDQQKQEYNYTQPQYISVEPVLILQQDKVKCKQLKIITVLSRCLGTIDRWEQILSNISDLGFNAVHYVPIQQYGLSYSHYSIKDQTLIADYYFGDQAQNLDSQQRLSILKEKVELFKYQYNLLGIVDIVLNHTANNSEWLLDYPEATYNTDNCPHLYSAWLLDQELYNFSYDFAKRKNVQECPSAPYINNENDLNRVIDIIQSRIIPKLKLVEFFQCNIEQTVQQARQFLNTELKEEDLNLYKKKFEKKKLFQEDHYKLLKEKYTIGYGGTDRRNVRVKEPEGIYYFYLANDRNQNKTIQELSSLLNKLNQDWAGQVDIFMKEAINAISGTIRYYKLELRDNLITDEKPLLPRYFTELPNQQKSKVAHNGWIMNHNPMIDFVMEGWNYLRRSINIWSDSVKLRYGSCPADSPFLWQQMSTYISDMASIFDGVRLDNAHSTPIHVCQYMLQIARSQNPNLFVMAELFTQSAETDAIFVQKLNINGLVRELQNTYNSKHLGDYFHYLTCREAVIGMIDTDFEDVQCNTYKLLKPKKPNEIIYDCTHDNPTPLNKFNNARLALPHIGVVSLADQAIATTWGYDLLIQQQLNVVTEKRLYSIYQQDDLFQFDGNNRQQLKQITPERTPEKKTTIEYEFEYFDSKAQKVQIAGEFTGWNPQLDLKKESNDRWIRSVEIPLIEGQSQYQYKFVINGSNWQCNPNKSMIDDGKGNKNNVIYTDKNPQQQLNQSQKGQNEKVFPDIRYIRKRLNQVHDECNRMNAEIYMHQQTDEVIVVVRQFELDYDDKFDAYITIQRPRYESGGDYKYSTTIELPGIIQEVVFASYLEIPQNAYQHQDQQQIRGINAQLKVYKNLDRFCKRETKYDKEFLIFYEMPPSFTCLLKTRYPSKMKDAVRKLNQFKKEDSRSFCHMFDNVPLSAINHLLFRCETEERDIFNNQRGNYHLEKYGSFVYSGLTSFIHLLRELKVSVDMGHELFNNMREGDWLLDYYKSRLDYMNQDLSQIIELFDHFLPNIKSLDRTFKPKYGSRLLEKIYNVVVYYLINKKMNDEFINSTTDPFLQKLSLSIAQFYGRIPSAYFDGHQDTLSAGLPHFSTGYMRCWGRDTFIALRGLFLCTGLFDEAKNIILYFAKVMRHGLIPNLHDRGNNTRFNARDATWFYLQVLFIYYQYVQAIQDYITMSKDYEFLNHEVELFFKDDNQQKHYEKKNQPRRKIKIVDQIQEILQCHARGIEYREWNAGKQIDDCMKDEGFNVKILFDEKTGFCFGGNKFNCGTWMDKMGSADINRGIPATPRDGAPIELVAMQFSTLKFMNEMNKQEYIQQKGVEIKSGFITYLEWAELMQANFERCFWIPQNQEEDKNYDLDKNLINTRGIYKDVYHCSDRFTDYQLRPNICIAMSYASELFSNEKAQICLQIIEKVLLEYGCMGIKTLDPSDKNYRGDYINDDFSRGHNYHQGPEWLWPFGFYLKAKLKFFNYSSKEDAMNDIMKLLLPHQKHIIKDVWESLPELTNSHGKECKDSCRAQAWSVSTIIDALRDLYYYENEAL